MTSAQERRDAAYLKYVDSPSTVAYFERVKDNGDEPWFKSEEERRELFDRRYTRPAPPAGMPSKTVAQIRGQKHRLGSPARYDLAA